MIIKENAIMRCARKKHKNASDQTECLVMKYTITETPNIHEFEQAPANSEGQGSLACCSPWGSQRVRDK